MTARGFLGGGFLSGFGSFSEVATNVATLPDISTPSAPTDGVKLFSSDIAGRSMLSTIDSGGLLTPLQPSWAHKNIGMWSAAGGSALIHETGSIGLQNVTGTITARTPDTASYCTSQTRVAIVSGAVATNLTTLRGASHLPKVWRGDAARRGGFTVAVRFNVSDAVLVATANMFIGIINTSMSADAAPSTLTNLIGVGCDNGDTALQLYAAGSSAQARTSLGASFPVNTTSVDVYEMTLSAAPNGSTVGYRVLRLNTGDVASGTISAAANLPSSTTQMNPQIFRSNGGTAAAVALDFSHIYVEAP